MKEILSKLVDGNNLTKEEAMHAQELILTGQATPAQIACFLTALRIKGETLDELTGLATVLRDKAQTISPKLDVVAAAGLPVAKHGNRLNMWILLEQAETVPIPLIFLQLRHLLSQLQDFRLQSMETVPFLPRVVPEMCLRHLELTFPLIQRS